MEQVASGQPLPPVDAAKLLAWLERSEASYRRRRREARLREDLQRDAVLSGMCAPCLALAVFVRAGEFAPDGEEVAP